MEKDTDKKSVDEHRKSAYEKRKDVKEIFHRVEVTDNCTRTKGDQDHQLEPASLRWLPVCVLSEEAKCLF